MRYVEDCIILFLIGGKSRVNVSIYAVKFYNSILDCSEMQFNFVGLV